MAKEVTSLEVHKLRRLGVQCGTRRRIRDVSVAEIMVAANRVGFVASELLPHRRLSGVDEVPRINPERRGDGE